MINLTKIARSVHNWIELIPPTMALGDLDFGKGAAAGLAMLGALATTEAAADGHDALVDKIDPAVLEEIQAGYQACVQDALKGSDWDGNFRIEGEEAAFYHEEALPLCDDRAESQINIALAEQRIAAADARIAEAEAGIARTNQELMDLVTGKTATN